MASTKRDSSNDNFDARRAPSSERCVANKKENKKQEIKKRDSSKDNFDARPLPAVRLPASVVAEAPEIENRPIELLRRGHVS